MDMVMDLEVKGQIMHYLKAENTGTRVGPSILLARNGPSAGQDGQGGQVLK